jgi:tetratricopeptide (TPR) repeat protein
MTKPMLVTLPFVLLLLDYWPLRRFQEIQPAHKIQKETLEVKKPADPEYKRSLIYPLLWEKVPLFALAILSSIVTYLVAQKAGSIPSIEYFPLSVRIGNALISYISYIGKMIWPSNLAFFYPHPGLLVLWQVLGSVLLLIAITLVVFWMVKRSPYLATGWLWYTGTLVPVIGIVQAGGQAMADRFTYIPLIGLFIIVAWGAPDLLKKWNYRKEILLASSALSILCLSIITWTQVRYWQNSITLYDHSLKVTDNNWLAYYSRGLAYHVLGNYRQAIVDYDRAIEINPGNADIYNNRGYAYNGLGNYKQAIVDYDRAIEINPGYAEAYNNRGVAYKGVGNFKKAIDNYSKAIEIKPGSAEAYNNRGNVYNGLGNDRQAIDDYSKAIEINPDLAAAYINRGVVYINQGDNISSCHDARKACELGNCKLLENAKQRGVCR